MKTLYTLASSESLVNINTGPVVRCTTNKGGISVQQDYPTRRNVELAYPPELLIQGFDGIVLDEEGADFGALSYATGERLQAAIDGKKRWGARMESVYPDRPRGWYNPFEIHPLWSRDLESLASRCAHIMDDAGANFDFVSPCLYWNPPEHIWNGTMLDYANRVIDIYLKALELCHPRPLLAPAIWDRDIRNWELTSRADTLAIAQVVYQRCDAALMFDAGMHAPAVRGEPYDAVRVRNERQDFYSIVNEVRGGA